MTKSNLRRTESCLVFYKCISCDIYPSFLHLWRYFLSYMRNLLKNRNCTLLTKRLQDGFLCSNSNWIFHRNCSFVVLFLRPFTRIFPNGNLTTCNRSFQNSAIHHWKGNCFLTCTSHKQRKFLKSVLDITEFLHGKVDTCIDNVQRDNNKALNRYGTIDLQKNDVVTITGWCVHLSPYGAYFTTCEYQSTRVASIWQSIQSLFFAFGSFIYTLIFNVFL